MHSKHPIARRVRPLSPSHLSLPARFVLVTSLIVTSLIMPRAAIALPPHGTAPEEPVADPSFADTQATISRNENVAFRNLNVAKLIPVTNHAEYAAATGFIDLMLSRLSLAADPHPKGDSLSGNTLARRYDLAQLWAPGSSHPDTTESRGLDLKGIKPGGWGLDLNPGRKGERNDDLRKTGASLLRELDQDDPPQWTRGSDDLNAQQLRRALESIERKKKHGELFEIAWQIKGPYAEGGVQDADRKNHNASFGGERSTISSSIDSDAPQAPFPANSRPNSDSKRRLHQAAADQAHAECSQPVTAISAQ